MPVYRAGTNRWRVRIWKKGVRQDWIVNGTKKDALAFEARKRVELESHASHGQRVAPTFSNFCVEVYKPHAQAHLRATTWSSRRYHLATLISFFGNMKITEVHPADIEQFKQLRLASGVRPISINNELAVMQAVYAYARHLNLPVATFKYKKLPVRHKSRLLVWSADDVSSLLDACARVSLDLVPVVTFLANTGCRRGEALALRWSDVDMRARMVRITPSEEWQSKSGKPREIPMSDELHEVMAGLPRRSEFVFSTQAGARFAYWPKRQFDRARKLSGLTGGPHTLRHTFASHFLSAVPDLFLLARVLGHSDTRVTKLYAHLLPDHLAKARNAVRFAAPSRGSTAQERAAARWKL